MLPRWIRAAARLRLEEFAPLAFFAPSAAVTLKASLFFMERGERLPPRIAHGLVRLAATAALMLVFFLLVKRGLLGRRLAADPAEPPSRVAAPFLHHERPRVRTTVVHALGSIGSKIHREEIVAALLLPVLEARSC